MKLTKRFITLAVICMLVVAAFPLAAFATNEERVSVYVQVPTDWQAPCAWAYNDDGRNAFAAWPGGELDADKANEGWYYVWLPKWADNVIINANGGTVQIDALKLDGKNAWITIKDSKTAEVSYDAKTKGTAPEFVEKFTVHATVPASWESVNLWAWSAPDGKNAFDAWPGRAMRKTDDGSFVSAAPVFVNSIIINGNDGKVQTADISVDAAEVWVTVAEDNSFEISYDDPAKASAPDIKVNVMAPADWSKPNLWAWSAPDGTNVFSAWPGEPLEAGDDGWLTKTVPGWINSIIVNAKDGTVQTTDITVETGKDIWLVVNGPEDFTVTYEKPAGVEAPKAPVSATSAVEPVQAQQPQQNNTVVIIIIAAAAVIALGAGGFVVYKHKKK